MTEPISSSAEEPADPLSRPLFSKVSFDLEKTAYLIIIILALVTRLWGIGDRVVSHDESLHTQYSFQYYNGDGYQHTALMHGPSLFHVTALSYWLFGDSDATARLPVAIIGTILVFLPYFLRDWVGRLGALVASFMLLISPYITYYSRYIRHDIYIITFAAITFIALLHYLRRRKDKYLWWFAIGMGLMFTTMETSYIYVAIFGSFLVLRLAAKLATSDWIRDLYPRLRTPFLLVVIAILMFVIGYAAQRLAPGVLADTTPEVGTVTEEGFAADPDEALASPEGEGQELGTVTAMRWLQIGSLLVLAASLFWTANRMRPFIDSYAEFDLIILFTTLTLPAATAFLIVLAGQDPLNFSPGICQLEGQESMSALRLFFARLGNPVCREAYLNASVVVPVAFTALTLLISLIVGVWWNRRRWLIAAAIFHGIFIILYTSFFTNPAGWTSGMVGSLGYWLAQQEVQRANQPTLFYFLVLPLYEFLPILFTLLAAYYWAKKNRLNRLLAYVIGVIGGALLVYSLANWFSNLDSPEITEASTDLGLILSSLVLGAGALFAVYWLLVRGRPMSDEESDGEGWQTKLDVEAIFGFVPYLIWWFLLSWVVYSLAGEKMAWLSSHFIMPMVLLVGWYINQKVLNANLDQIPTWRYVAHIALVAVLLLAIALALAPILLGRVNLGGQETANLSGLGRILGGLLVAGIIFYFVRQSGKQFEPGTSRLAVLLAIFGLLSLMTIRFTYMAAFPNADYVNEFLVYAHGAPATKREVLSQLEDLSMRQNGDKSIKVAFDNDSSWPFTWYLREYPSRIYFGENPGRNITEAPVVIVGSQNWSKVEPLLGDDYDSREYTFLWWPMEEYRQISWSSIFGDPNAEPELRRGLGNPDVRAALWDIFFHRDYEKYGEVFGGVYTPGQWPLKHNLRMYIRKDSLATIWDHGLDAVAAEPAVDPYAENELQPAPDLIIGALGSGDGQLQQPRNLALGPDGLIYVADSGNSRIQVFDQNGQFLRKWGAFGSEPGLFNEPWGIAVGDRYVYVADTWNHRIQKFSHEGELIEVLGQSGSPSPGEVGGGLFFGPRDIVILPDGNLLVTDTGNHRLQVLDPEGNFIEEIGFQGSQLGQFYEPVGIDLSPDDSIFLADTWNGRVQELSTDLIPFNEWEVDAWFGESINNKPYLAVDRAGRVYITDPEGYRVLVFNDAGQYLGRFGQYSTGSDGFGLPNGIVVDEDGTVYVADAGNSHILRFAPIFE